MGKLLYTGIIFCTIIEYTIKYHHCFVWFVEFFLKEKTCHIKNIRSLYLYLLMLIIWIIMGIFPYEGRGRAVPNINGSKDKLLVISNII